MAGEGSHRISRRGGIHYLNNVKANSFLFLIAILFLSVDLRRELHSEAGDEGDRAVEAVVS